MTTYPDARVAGGLRAAEPPLVTTARFDMDFRGALLPDGLIAEARAAAQAQGYAAGWAEGKRQARNTAHAVAARTQAAAAGRTAQVEQALTAVATAARRLEQRAAQPTAEVEELILRAALALTETLVGHELAASRTPGEDAIRRALALAPLGRPVLVRLNPAEHMLVAASGAHREIDGRTVTLLADPALRPGDAVAICDSTTIDARVHAALDRVRAALGGSEPAPSEPALPEPALREPALHEPALRGPALPEGGQ
jgi:flagellar assembly protein FliH